MCVQVIVFADSLTSDLHMIMLPLSGMHKLQEVVPLDASSKRLGAFKVLHMGSFTTAAECHGRC